MSRQPRPTTGDTGQPRIPAGHTGGGRFATAECPTTYRLLAAARPAGEPVARPGGGWAVPAPRCPHGHFARWAAGHDEKGRPNCPRCAAGR